jgi:hypothetical protein
MFAINQKTEESLFLLLPMHSIKQALVTSNGGSHHDGAVLHHTWAVNQRGGAHHEDQSGGTHEDQSTQVGQSGDAHEVQTNQVVHRGHGAHEDQAHQMGQRSVAHEDQALQEVVLRGSDGAHEIQALQLQVGQSDGAHENQALQEGVQRGGGTHEDQALQAAVHGNGVPEVAEDPCSNAPATEARALSTQAHALKVLESSLDVLLVKQESHHQEARKMRLDVVVVEEEEEVRLGASDGEEEAVLAFQEAARDEMVELA